MTDLELLEMAAKAAGLPIELEGDAVGWHPCGRDENGDVAMWWNPLISDGDAQRLAVALRFTVKIEDHEIEVFNWEGCIVSIGVFAGDDYEAATRRAIVRAAAEIGKEMK